jgi:1-acyl-sn-glycerol-3-phosphate acyltransferase
VARRGDLNGWWRFGVVVVGAVTTLFFRVRVTGAERIPASGSAIVAANHLSALDGIVLAAVVGRHRRRMTRFLTAAEFFRKPAIAWALRVYRQIPLRRGEGDADALDEAIRTVRGGALAGIFPEGHVNPSPSSGLRRGRTGVARIALASGAPIVPVGIWGTHLRYPREGVRFGPPWRPTLALAFGEPISSESERPSREDARRLTERVMNRIAVEVDDARRLADA